jgi:spore germination protein KB
MPQFERISSKQFTVLVFLYTIGTTILVIPSGLAATAKQDAWLGGVAGILLNIGVVFLFIKIWEMYPEQSFVGICEKLLGKYVGRLLTVLFIFYSFIGSTTVLYYVGDFMRTNILVETPILFLHAFFAIVMVMAIRLGIEVIARTAEIFLPWFLFLGGMFILIVIPDINFDWMLPILETGFKPILHNAISIAGTASLPFLSFFMIFPKIKNIKEAKKGFYFATITGGLFICVITFLCITVLGPELTARNMYPTYILAKKINIGNFLQRIEVIIAITWMVSTYFKLTIYFYGLTVSVAELFKLQDYRILCYPLGIIVIVVSFFIYPNATYMMEWDSTIFIPYIYSIGLLIPLLLLIVGLVRKRAR